MTAQTNLIGSRVFNTYSGDSLPQSDCLEKTGSALSVFARKAFGKQVNIKSDSEVITTTHNCAVRILCAVVAILLAPITFIGTLLIALSCTQKKAHDVATATFPKPETKETPAEKLATNITSEPAVKKALEDAEVTTKEQKNDAANEEPSKQASEETTIQTSAETTTEKPITTASEDPGLKVSSSEQQTIKADKDEGADKETSLPSLIGDDSTTLVTVTDKETEEAVEELEYEPLPENILDSTDTGFEYDPIPVVPQDDSKAEESTITPAKKDSPAKEKTSEEKSTATPKRQTPRETPESTPVNSPFKGVQTKTPKETAAPARAEQTLPVKKEDFEELFRQIKFSGALSSSVKISMPIYRNLNAHLKSLNQQNISIFDQTEKDPLIHAIKEDETTHEEVKKDPKDQTGKKTATVFHKYCYISLFATYAPLDQLENYISKVNRKWPGATDEIKQLINNVKTQRESAIKL
jgi:hypothetical protein